MRDTIELDFDVVEKRLKRLRPKIVLLQLPSGLKRKAPQIAEEIERRFACEVLISGDSCYGACDVPSATLGHIDAIIQAGHSTMPTIKCSKPIIFVPGKLNIDLDRLIESATRLLKSPVGLLATAQHIDRLDDAKRLLKQKGFEVRIGKGSRRLASQGQILGCDYSAAHAISKSVSSYLILGGGRFHAIGLKLATGKPVIIADPERRDAVLEEIDTDAFLKRRYAVIEKLENAKSIAIFVSTKTGQNRFALAKQLIKSASKKKSCRIVLVDEISPDKLEDLGFDAYVSTACPRIALDDLDRYKRQIATPTELLIALGEMRWENYLIDEWGFAMQEKRK